MSQKENHLELKKNTFKTKPAPHSISSGPRLPVVPKKPSTVPKPFNLTVKHKINNPTPKKDIPRFKANPVPIKILAAPEIPVKFLRKTLQSKQLPKPQVLAPFKLATEIRAAERAKFDRKIKEKENAYLVNHPIPIPTYKQFAVKHSGTIPEPPKIIRKLKAKQTQTEQ
ncbi:protein TPX2-like [Pieris rapae]|uniref:protein TPX2-like n=1 Tax=Pieris rapae TaxID=64459 RepID=UPI001E27EB00|nr:protein TPX2-like [Pieris rapae]